MNTYWIIYLEKKLLLIKSGDNFFLPQSNNIDKHIPQLIHKHDVGDFNGYHFKCGFLQSLEIPIENAEWVSLRKGLELLGFEWYQAITKGYSIIMWDHNHQFCGHCAHPTIHESKILERKCTYCGLIFYPRISPSVIALIQRGDEILMARSPHFMPGAYGLVAGFVEVGESLEQAIQREVKEEVNIEIKNLRYFGSQPWPFPDSLMVAFLADYAGGELQIDNVEIEAAGWYRYDNLPGKPGSNVGIARKLVNHFIAEQEALRK